jgi:hypothetical protein
MAQDNLSTITTCQECQKQSALYACPRCRRRTCSLACCQSHKDRFHCNGKRDLTAFQPLSRMTDATLQSDYHFLENVLATMESGRKLVQQQGGGTGQQQRQIGDHSVGRASMELSHHYGNKRQKTEPLSSSSSFPKISSAWLLDNSQSQQQQSCMNAKQKQFVQRAAQRGVTVLIQPSMMQRNQQNKSHVTRQGDLFWTVEWRLYASSSSSSSCDNAQGTIRTFYSQVNDTAVLTQALEECIQTLDNPLVSSSRSNSH